MAALGVQPSLHLAWLKRTEFAPEAPAAKFVQH